MQEQEIVQHLRVHTEKVTPEEKKDRKIYPKTEHWYDRYLAAYQYQYCLVFDTETTTDEKQLLRFGTYELHGKAEHEIFWGFEEHGLFNTENELTGFLPQDYMDTLLEKGIFYEPAMLTPEELRLIVQYAASNRMSLITKQEFIDLLYTYAHHKEKHAVVIGHNLAFDLSRLSTEVSEAKGQYENGFSLKLCSCEWERKEHDGKRARKRNNGDSCRKHPNLRMKNIGPKADMYEWSDRKPSGCFLDTQTIARALLGPGSMSLHTLGTILDIESKKLLQDSTGAKIEHNQKLSTEYLDYAVRDTQATWQIYQKLRNIYASYGFRTKLHKIYSEASLGKAMYREMGITPPMQRMQNIEPKYFGYAMTGYYGGRSEVHWRLEPKEVLYCDFKSEYPTVFSLMNLQRDLLGKRFKIKDAKEKAHDVLHYYTLDHLKLSNYWIPLKVMCKIKGSGLILPIRAKFDGLDTNIALCETNLSHPTWYTLSDVLASQLLGGQEPEIIEAFEVVPQGQIKTKELYMFNDLVCINPAQDDIFVTLINERTELKRLAKAGRNDTERLQRAQQALKLLANSTSYGVNVEMHMEKSQEPVKVYGNDEPYVSATPLLQVPGMYYNPLIGTHIPAGGRLLLAMAQRLASDRGLMYALCDTDSMAFIKPDSMEREEFTRHVMDIIDFFTPLSPYAGKPKIFELEDVNRWDNALEQLYCLAISAKRYVLYNKKSDGTFRIRKVSAHGLGAYSVPESYTSPIGTPEPEVSLSSMGLSQYQRWIYDMWYSLIYEAERRHVLQS